MLEAVRKRFKILVCRGPECGDKRNSAAVAAQLLVALRETPPPEAEVEVGWQSCFGQCAHGPNVLVREVRQGENGLRLSMMPTLAPGAVLYHRVDASEAGRIISEHLMSGRVIADWTRKTEPDREPP